MKKSFWILLLCLSSAFVFGDARIMNSEKPAWISVESSCKSHLVRVNEPFEFIINSNRKQKLKVIISQDGEAVLKNLTVTPPAAVTVSWVVKIDRCRKHGKLFGEMRFRALYYLLYFFGNKIFAFCISEADIILGIKDACGGDAAFFKNSRHFIISFQ